MDEDQDRRPLDQRELERVSLEIAVGCVSWVAIVFWLFELHDSLQLVVAIGGAIGVGLAIGWWRIIRHGPEGPPRRRRAFTRDFGTDPPDGLGARVLLISAFGSLVMCVLLVAKGPDDDRAFAWGAVFGAIAIVNYVRYLRHRDR